MRRWWNWYTRYFEGVVVARPCEFESHPAHQICSNGQRRDGRVVDCGGLENRWAERLRGFESLSLRKRNKGVRKGSFNFLWEGGGPSHARGRGLLSRLARTIRSNGIFASESLSLRKPKWRTSPLGLVFLYIDTWTSTGWMEICIDTKKEGYSSNFFILCCTGCPWQRLGITKKSLSFLMCRLTC